MSTYYFTYGTDAAYPYYGGWTEVEAPDEKTARALFKAYHPNREGSDCLNCASVYSEDGFKKTGMMDVGNFGKKCLEQIAPTRTFPSPVLNGDKSLKGGYEVVLSDVPANISEEPYRELWDSTAMFEYLDTYGADVGRVIGKFDTQEEAEEFFEQSKALCRAYLYYETETYLYFNYLRIETVEYDEDGVICDWGDTINDYVPDVQIRV